RMRDILDANAIFYDNGVYSSYAEDVFMFSVTPNLNPTVRVRVSKNNLETRTLFQPGFVWVPGGGFYAEAIYGLSTNEFGDIAQEGSLEGVRETDDSTASIKVKGNYNHATGFWYVIPSAYFEWYVLPQYAPKLGYYYGHYSDGIDAHTVLLENTYALQKRFFFTLVSSGVLSFDDGQTAWEWSAGLKLRAKITSSLSLKYLIIYHGLEHSQGLENGLTVDWKF
ncbi:MAG TPA: hypothetical protein PKO22_10905, partial [Treponemataceae bacterium]|nr:hypothetical protein [Treponemataceae bacterium]